MSKMINETICVLKFLLFFCIFSSCSWVRWVLSAAGGENGELGNSVLGARWAQSSRKPAVALQKRTPKPDESPRNGLCFSCTVFGSYHLSCGCSHGGVFFQQQLPSILVGLRARAPVPASSIGGPSLVRGESYMPSEGICVGRDPSPERKRHPTGYP